VRDRSLALFTASVVEQSHVDAFDRGWIEAMHVDVEAVRVRTRHVEALDAAMTAEAMLRGARIERVFAQRAGAGEQAEAHRRDDQVQEAAHAADRTIAVERGDRRRCIDLETHAAAMAPAAMHDQRDLAHARGST
jgi:hypothetical protein